MKHFLLFFLLSFSMAFSQSNTTTDLLQKISEHPKEDTTKVKLMLQLSASYYGVDSKKVSDIAKDALDLSNKLSYKKGIAESLKLQGAAYISLGDYKTAEDYFSQSLKIYQAVNYSPGIIICYSNLGSSKLYQNKYAEALKYYQMSIRYAKKSKDFKNSAIAYGNMGIIYSELKNYDLALMHFNQALQNHIKSKNENGVASAYSNIGTVYLNLNDYKKAHQYYQLALDKNKEIGNQLGISREYGNIASLYMKENNYVKTYENVNSALKINKELNNKKGIALDFQRLGEYYLHENQMKEALYYFSKSLKIASEIGSKDLEKTNFKSLSELYEQEKNQDSAYYFYKKYIDIKEALDNENNRKQISRLEIQYEFDSKEEKYKNQQILDGERLKQNKLLLDLNSLKLSESNKARDLAHLEYLKTQTELKNEQLESGVRKKQLEISRKEIQLRKNEIKVNKLKLLAKEKEKWYFISGTALLAVIGGLLFYQNRLRKKSNSKLLVLNKELDEANKNKVRFLGILNHDLRSPVASLVNFLHLKNNSPELLDSATKERLDQQTIISAENLLQQMEDLLLWSKSQMEKFHPEKKLFASEQLISEIKKEFAWVENVRFSFQFPENLQIYSDKELVKTIIRNIINNAIKVLQNKEDGSIICSVSENEKMVLISVRDNGGGANMKKFRALYDDNESIGIKNGLGLHLIRDLAKSINSEIAVDSDLKNGETEIILQIKKQKS